MENLEKEESDKDLLLRLYSQVVLNAGNLERLKDSIRGLDEVDAVKICDNIDKARELLGYTMSDLVYCLGALEVEHMHG